MSRVGYMDGDPQTNLFNLCPMRALDQYLDRRLCGLSLWILNYSTKKKKSLDS